MIVVGTGRTPHTDGLGLDSAGAAFGDRGEVVVDERCRAADGLWAIGDVTGIMPFTHVAKYQARVVADNILGTARTARYDGIPRVVFADPEVAAVGLTRRQAEQQGLRVSYAEVGLADAIARPWTYERDPRGHLGALADTQRQVLVGAWAVGPQATEWIHTAALAVREHVPLDRLRDQVPQFPTYNEAWLEAFKALKS